MAVWLPVSHSTFVRILGDLHCMASFCLGLNILVGVEGIDHVFSLPVFNSRIVAFLGEEIRTAASFQPLLENIS